MAEKLLLTLKERPSFEGELTVRLMEERDSEGQASYFLLCEKKAPLNVAELRLISGLLDADLGIDAEEIKRGVVWRKYVPPAEAREFIEILEGQFVPVVPETTSGLDGTTYELLIERGLTNIPFAWWNEPPGVWKALGELSKRLLAIADAAQMTRSLQSNTRKRRIENLQKELDEKIVAQNNDKKALLKAHNDRSRELAASLIVTGLTCPACGQYSKEFRFVDKGPNAKSHFVCKRCGRSFRPEDL
jgi:hypothetical protein